MKPFTKNEILGVTTILAFIGVLSFYNFRFALRRARDAQRRADLGAISNALHSYQLDFGFFPPATDDGKILACPKDNYSEISQEAVTDQGLDLNKYFDALRPCDWGEDSLRDLEDIDYPAYMNTIPSDPRNGNGIVYKYFSNTKRFQIYAYLEGEDEEDGFNKSIVQRNVQCGNKVCNFGKSFGMTPLDKSIEEYENELLQEQLRLEELQRQK